MSEILKKAQNELQETSLPVDKREDCWTVSQKFREDIKQFFAPQKYTFLEIGCYKGWTAKFLADHFIEYLGLDIKDEHLELARIINASNHAQFQKFDIYSSNWNDLNFSADIVLIDALHEYQYIKQDIENCLKRFKNAFFIFDDYGAWESVFRAVNEAIEENKLKVVQEIGLGKDQQLWSDESNPHAYTHFGSEGLICLSC